MGIIEWIRGYTIIATDKVNLAPCRNLRYVNLLEVSAVVESLMSDILDGFANGHRSQAGTVGESIIIDPLDGIGNSHRCQVSATGEGIMADTLDGVGNNHRCQFSATGESFKINIPNGIGHSVYVYRLRNSNFATASFAIEDGSAIKWKKFIVPLINPVDSDYLREGRD